MQPNTQAPETKKERTPGGVIIIALLLIVGAFFAGGLGALVPTATLNAFGLPRSLLLVGALITALLAYGLLRLRRWAWAATLSFVFVNAYFLLLNAEVDGTTQYPGLIVLIVIAAYLLWPKVRVRFFQQQRS